MNLNQKQIDKLAAAIVSEAVARIAVGGAFKAFGDVKVFDRPAPESAGLKRATKAIHDRESKLVAKSTKKANGEGNALRKAKKLLAKMNRSAKKKATEKPYKDGVRADKRKRAPRDMSCRAAGCTDQSLGPRFRYFCRQHTDELSETDKKSALQIYAEGQKAKG